MRKIILFSWASFCLTLPAIAQEKTLADQKTEQEIEKLRMEVQKGQLDALSSVRSLSGPAAQVATPTDTAEAMTLKYAIYDEAFKSLAEDVKTTVVGATPTIVFGTTPPSISAWLAHQDNTITAARALALATKTWSEERSRKASQIGQPQALVGAVPLISAVVSTLVSALRSDTTIQGAMLKAEEASLSMMLMNHLSARGHTISFAEFTPSRSAGALADIDTLLHRDVFYGPEADAHGNLAYLQTKALAAYQTEFLPRKKALEAELKKAVDANNVGEAAMIRAKLAAGENLAAALGLYNVIRDNLLASTNGVVNATQILRMKAFAEADGDTRPVLYILTKEAALTTVTKKGLFVGWRSTPTTLRVGLRIDYILSSNKPKRGTVRCLSSQIKFDKIDLASEGTLTNEFVCKTNSTTY